MDCLLVPPTVHRAFKQSQRKIVKLAKVFSLESLPAIYGMLCPYYKRRFNSTTYQKVRRGRIDFVFVQEKYGHLHVLFRRSSTVNWCYSFLYMIETNDYRMDYMNLKLV